MGSPHRVPLEPLMRMARLAIDEDEVSLSAYADLFGINRRTMYRWRDRGTVPLWAADVIATKLGSHLNIVYAMEELPA